MTPMVETTCDRCGQPITVVVEVIATGPSTVELAPVIDHECEDTAERWAELLPTDRREEDPSRARPQGAMERWHD